MTQVPRNVACVFIAVEPNVKTRWYQVHEPDGGVGVRCKFAKVCERHLIGGKWSRLVLKKSGRCVLKSSTFAPTKSRKRIFKKMDDIGARNLGLANE